MGFGAKKKTDYETMNTNGASAIAQYDDWEFGEYEEEAKAVEMVSKACGQSVAA